jgi:hypothetical protein
MKRIFRPGWQIGLTLLLVGCGREPAAVAPATTPTLRDFNMAIRCPAVEWEKTHGWTAPQIMRQESIQEADISDCEQWTDAESKAP